jgi:hypothetical protein
MSGVIQSQEFKLPVLAEGVMNPQNHFKLPEGSHLSFNGQFDPDLGLGPIPVRRLDHWTIEKLANERLAKYGYSPITKEDRDVPCDHIASEVGDDEETLFRNKAMCGYNMAFHILFGMKVSEEDTCVSSRFGNFAEDLIVLPDGYYQTYLNSRNTSGAIDMSYVDVPKLRLAIDIRPMRVDHSATNDGKASMCGSRLSWLPKEHPLQGIWQSFSLFQDIHLGIHRDKRFAYLPQTLGGYGKPLPFNEPSNLERFMKAFRQGSHSNLIRAIVRRASYFLFQEERGLNPPKDLLLSHVARFQASFHDWIKGKSIYCPISWIDIPPELVEHEAGRLGKSRELDDVLGRLVQDRFLVTETQLEIAVEHNNLCNALLECETVPEFKRLRDEKRREWMSSSIFSLESYGLIEEICYTGEQSKQPLKSHEIFNFYARVLSKRANLKALLREEPVYWKSALDHVYKTGPMNVKFNMTPYNKVWGMQFASQTIAYREDMENTEEIGAHQALIDWLKGGQKGPAPRMIINDDHSIIREAADYDSVILITEDIKLCRSLNSKVGIPVFRVPCEWYYRALYFGDEPDPWTKFMMKRAPNKSWKVIEDTGSIQSFEELYFKDGMMAKARIRQPFSMTKTIGEKDPTTVVESENFTSDPPDYCDPDELLFDRTNIILQRRNHRKVYTSRNNAFG